MAIKKGYHRTKSGKIAKKGLWYNVNQRKKKGTSRSKAKSTISAKAYRNSQAQFSYRTGVMVGKKKTWNKSKLYMKCGECHICKKEHYSEIGGWIINAEKKLFCETHTEGKESCFDEYIKRKTIPFNDW